MSRWDLKVQTGCSSQAVCSQWASDNGGNAGERIGDSYTAVNVPDAPPIGNQEAATATDIRLTPARHHAAGGAGTALYEWGVMHLKRRSVNAGRQGKSKLLGDLPLRFPVCRRPRHDVVNPRAAIGFPQSLNRNADRPARLRGMTCQAGANPTCRQKPARH